MTDIDFSEGMAQITQPVDDGKWHNVERPGYFGRRRDLRIAQYNLRFGVGNWRLAWRFDKRMLTFQEACIECYEESYFRALCDRPDDIDYICTFTECMDNAPTNVQSGCDYTVQEAFSTHIQDIAIRNVLRRLGRGFTGERGELLIIRSVDSNGYRFGPGNIPFLDPSLITTPTKTPGWANADSVEAFWQANKYLQARDGIAG